MRRITGWRSIVALAGVLCQGAPVLAQASSVDHGGRLTLKAALREALHNGPALRGPTDAAALAEIRERVAASRFALKIAPTFRSGSEPLGLNQRLLGVGISKQLPFGTDLTFSADTVRYESRASEFRDGGFVLSLSQPLLRGFGVTSRADLADANRDAIGSARARDEARQQFVVTVADAYFAVVRQRRLVEAGERAADRALRLRAASDARAKVGLATQLDVLRADLQAAQAAADVTAQREGLAAALDSLKLLLGRAPDASIDVADSDANAAAVSDEDLASRPVEELVSLALAARPEVKEVRDRVEDAQRRTSVARWNLLPDLRLTASYTRRGLGSAASDALNELYGGWRVGLSSSYSLDRAAQFAGVETALVAARGARQAALDTEWRIAADVRRAHRACRRAADMIAIQRKALDLAERQVRLAEIRYERGLAGNFDVIEAEGHAFQARTALISAEVDRALSHLLLRRVVGALDPEEFAR